MPGKRIALPVKFFGVPVYLDWSLFLALPFFAFMIARSMPALIEVLEVPVDLAALDDPRVAITLGLLSAVGLFISILVHELGHSVVALRYGLEVRSITLWLLGGVARLAKMPRARGVEAVVAIAGPITSFLVAGVCKVLGILMLESFSLGAFLFAYLAYMNLALAIFNLLPALPLDGGRVLRSLLAIRMSHIDATRACVSCSRVICILFVLLSLVTGNILLVVVAAFVFLASGSELAAATIEAALRGLHVRDLMTTGADTVPASMLVCELRDRMMAQKHLAFPVVDEFGCLRGVVSYVDLKRARALLGPSENRTVSDMMSRGSHTCTPLEPAEEVWDRLVEAKSEQLPVVDDNGQLIGVVSRTDFLRAIEVRSLSPEGARES